MHNVNSYLYSIAGVENRLLNMAENVIVVDRVVRLMQCGWIWQSSNLRGGWILKKFVVIGISVLMVIFMAYSAHAEVKALWLFDEGSGTVATDSSDNGCDGIIEGAKYVQGKYGTGLKFDGASWVDVGFPDALQVDIEGPFTAETWIKLDKSPPSDHSTIILMQADGTLSIGFTSSTGGGFYGYAGDNVKLTDPDAEFPVGEWVHIAHTFDGETQRLYRNGEEIASQNAIQANFDHPEDSPWTIGAWSEPKQYFLENAILDEMRVSNEAVEPEELGFFARFSPVEPQGKLSSCWGEIKSD